MSKIIIPAIIIVIILAFVGGLTLGLGGFGTGDGSGERNQILNAITEDKSQNEEVIIKVEENKIYFGEEECVDVEDLTAKISKITTQKENIKFVFEHEYAIKATYDEVKQTLINLEEYWDISIDYKE